MAISKYKTKTGERYKATLWQNNKPVRTESFRRKADAQDWLRQEKNRQDDLRVGRSLASVQTLGDFFRNTYSLHHGVRESTWTDYLRIFKTHIEPYFGSRPMNNVSVEEWANHFKKLMQLGMSKARVNRVHGATSAIYGLAVKWREIEINPLTFVNYEQEDLKPVRSWSDEEFRRFMTWAKENSSPFFSAYHCMYETGMRVSELIALKWDCVDLVQGVLEVRRAYSRITKQHEETTKTQKIRILGINESLRKTLFVLYEARKSDFVFAKDDGGALQYEQLFQTFQREQRSAGVPKMGLHGFRHTYASHFVMKGESIFDLQSLLGHSDINTTRRYAHLSPLHLKKKSAVIQYDPANHFPTMEQETEFNEMKKESN